jgi:hypothetical protein
VKTLCADASVDFVDVKVGHCQALNLMKMKTPVGESWRGFFRLYDTPSLLHFDIRDYLSIGISWSSYDPC